MNHTLECDLVILGGGIAGLWTLHRAVQSGYNAILFEKSSLGCGQTIHSQGIIHGGIKYALNGVLSSASNTIKEMPDIWRKCLAGSGEIDLSGTNLLSDAHYMWSKQTVGAKLTTFFASKALRGRVSNLEPEQRPEVFRNPGFKGSLYRLNELVLDIPSLINQLATPLANRIFRAGPEDYRLENIDGKVCFHFDAQQLRLCPKRIVATCGEGTEAFSQQLQGIALPEMQRRPLHMVMVKHHSKLPLYAHCFSGGAKPVITVTTHYTRAGETIWYLGGELAESGVERDETAQIEQAKKVLAELLPWVSLQNPHWQTVRINRAEPKQSSLTLPDAAFAQEVGNVIVAWPTKLALAPDLAGKVLALMPSPVGGNIPDLEIMPHPVVASPLWEMGNWQ